MIECSPPIIARINHHPRGGELIASLFPSLSWMAPPRAPIQKVRQDLFTFPRPKAIDQPLELRALRTVQRTVPSSLNNQYICRRPSRISPPSPLPRCLTDEGGCQSQAETRRERDDANSSQPATTTVAAATHGSNSTEGIHQWEMTPPESNRQQQRRRSSDF